ncbi:monovalent cation/H(+) antiporter subunit G [Nocardioides sp. Y6]|uniref:Monovalent cation/H(+) antiporter subunit G n=1 Tax=Nocardioides malaquae TaxID=2773426 RepID=A0ABR9RW35_9ACTN|nr:monovalent cation/H(+) antiporter subunit G [Nocardioides malaquae]MBE7325767.1 monovalent cation/H(+) antiporter subunit G [Nocardioides malaquae]
MSWVDVMDGASAVLLLAGSVFALIAAIGVVRLPDLLSRMHAATKPQVIGLMLVVSGLALRLRDPSVLAMLFFVVLLQMGTSVVSSHMVARANYRTGRLRKDLLVLDELTAEQKNWEDQRGAP